MQVMFAQERRVVTTANQRTSMTAQWTNHVHSFQVQLMRVLLLNLSSSSAEEVSKGLQSEDHVLLKACNVGVDAIISLGTQVLFAEATPFDLSCWHLISQMKSVSDQPIPKIVLIVYGGALERSCALELGADHVLSGPIEPVGLSAQIKAAIQTKEAGACRRLSLHELSKRAELWKTRWKHQPAATPSRRPSELFTECWFSPQR